MLMHMNHFGTLPVPYHGEPAAYRNACWEAYQRFEAWKTAHRVSSSQRRFTYWMIFKEEFGTYLNTKGYNARVISAWLEHELELAHTAPCPGLLQDERSYLSLVAVSPGSYSIYIWFP